MPRGDDPFQVIKKINDNAYELDLLDTYLGSDSFNISDLTHLSTSLPNSWTNSLPPEEHGEEGTYYPSPTHDHITHHTSEDY